MQFSIFLFFLLFCKKFLTFVNNIESSQESDISFISFAPDFQGSQLSIPSSQEDMDVAVEDDDGWTNGKTNVQLYDFDA